jgi:hypothetical protein
MTKEDIYKMVRGSELGFLLGDNWMLHHEFEYFAKLVAQHEREACAKVCDNRVTAYKYATDVWAQEHIDEARHLANAIRARGQA